MVPICVSSRYRRRRRGECQGEEAAFVWSEDKEKKQFSELQRRWRTALGRMRDRFSRATGCFQRPNEHTAVSLPCAPPIGQISEVLSSQLLRERTARALAPTKFRERRAKIGDRKIRPALVQENEFGKRTFPQKKIGKPLLATGANQEIDVG